MSDAVNTPLGSSHEIAVIGMAGRFPEAPNLDAFWANLAAGRNSSSRFTEAELAEAGVPRLLRDSPAFVPVHAIVRDADAFDAEFFGVSPAEASVMDPQHRVLLEVAWTSLENAGYDPERYAGLIGVYVGADVSLYATRLMVSRAQDPLTLISNNRDYLATRIAFKLNLRGPAITVQTACSTSLVSVQLACQALLGYQCDIALAGGVGINFPQKAGYIYQEGSVLSPDGITRAFDAKAKGTFGGDGCGLVVLKRLEDAMADGDSICAVIKAAAINNDGSAKLGFTAPSVEGQADVIAGAHALAGITPESITYLEAHGTGTPLGDTVELAALDDVFRAGTERRRFCAIGSLKTNVGHMNSASGIGGLLKTILALQHRQIPPSLNFETPNPQIDWANSCFFVNTELRPWEGGGGPRRAGVSSFGVGGTNAHVIVEEAPEFSPPSAPRPAYLMVLSARSEAALERLEADVIAHAKTEQRSASLGDLSHTLLVGRRLHRYRRMAVCRDCSELEEALRAAPLSLAPAGLALSTVYLFPGQGLQFPGMAAGLYRCEPGFRRAVDRGAAILETKLGRDIRDVMFNGTADAGVELANTSLTQPALFVIEHALASLWESWGLTPDAMLGHSVGEYVAACLAGVMTFEEAIEMLVARGTLVQALPPGAMLAVPLPEAELRGRFEGLDIAAVNSPASTVIAGSHEAVATALRSLEDTGISARHLRTSHAFHSSMMDAALESFRDAVRNIRLRPPQRPYLSNVTGTWISERDATDSEYWVRHLRETVRFGDCVRELLQAPDRVFVELGPGRALGSLVKQQTEGSVPILRSLRLPEESTNDWEVVLQSLGQLYLMGVPVDWGRFHQGQGLRRVPLPTYPFERERYLVKLPSLDLAETQVHVAEREPSTAIDGVEAYVPLWIRAPVLSASVDTPEGPWLVFEGHSPLGLALVERLRAMRRTVIVVRKGREFRDEGHIVEIDPARAAHFEQLIAALNRERCPRVVLHLWSLDSDGFVDPQSNGLYSILNLGKALRASSRHEPLTLAVVTSGTADVLGDEVLEPVRSTILASRVLSQELDQIGVRLIDVRTGDDRLGTASAILGELTNQDGADYVALREGRRWVPYYKPYAHSTNGSSMVREGGVYMITGGLGHVGLSIAQHLAKRFRAKLVLTNRSGFPNREMWDTWLNGHHASDPVSRTISRLLAIEASGGKVLALEADVCSRAEMTEAFRRAATRFGPVNGVIHAAGLGGAAAFRPLSDTDRHDCDALLKAKVEGTRVLQEVVPGDADFVMLVSSLSTVLGGVGLFSYAAAHHYLDALAANKTCSPRPRWVAVDWDAWLPAGEEIRRPVSGSAISPDAGGRMLEMALSGPHIARLAVSTANLERRITSSGRRRVGDLTTTAGRGAARRARPKIETGYAPPETKLQRELISIWEDLLGIDGIGIDDNFLSLGGDSLMAIELKARVRDTVGADLAMDAMFEEPTVAGVARRVAAALENAREHGEVLDAALSLVEQMSEEDVKRKLAEFRRG